MTVVGSQVTRTARRVRDWWWRRVSRPHLERAFPDLAGADGLTIGLDLGRALGRQLDADLLPVLDRRSGRSVRRSRHRR
jgi:hypothetical protein